MTCHGVQIAEDVVEAFCRRHRVQRLALFGSILRDDFGPDSDIDMLVEFEPDAQVGFIRLAGIERELGALVGRNVDLNTPGSFREPLRRRILAEAEVLYDAG